MNKREYSTKNIDRILRQANGLVANKRGKNSVLANGGFEIKEDIYYVKPAAGTLVIIIGENNIYSFNDYYNDYHNETKRNNKLDKKAYRDYNRIWKEKAKEFLHNEGLEHYLDYLDSRLSYYYIIAYFNEGTSIPNTAFDLPNEMIILIQEHEAYKQSIIRKYGEAIIPQIEEEEEWQIDMINREFSKIADKYNFKIRKSDEF